MKKLICMFTLAVLCLTFFTSCGAPKEITDMAMKYTEDICSRYEKQCQDIQIVRAKQKELTKADTMNGLAAWWCIEVKYMYNSPMGWEEIYNLVLIRKNNDGSYETGGSPPSGGWDEKHKDEMFDWCMSGLE